MTIPTNPALIALAGAAMVLDAAHPDLPAPTMCDPMPTFVQVCTWKPSDPRQGQWPCPRGYVQINKVVPGSCPQDILIKVKP